MDKIAVGGGLPADVVDIDKDPEANLRSLAAAKNCEVADLVAASSTDRATPTSSPPCGPPARVSC